MYIYAALKSLVHVERSRMVQVSAFIALSSGEKHVRTRNSVPNAESTTPIHTHTHTHTHTQAHLAVLEELQSCLVHLGSLAAGVFKLRLCVEGRAVKPVPGNRSVQHCQLQQHLEGGGGGSVGNVQVHVTTLILYMYMYIHCTYMSLYVMLCTCLYKEAQQNTLQSVHIYHTCTYMFLPPICYIGTNSL